MIKELALILSGLVVLGGCGPAEDDGAAPGALSQGLKGPRATGRDLFVKETFGGNGRTCQTCHSTQTGTVSPEEVRRRLRHGRDPLLLHDGLDDDGVGTTRIAAEATIRITLPLPPYVRVKGDPAATTIDVFRGISSTINTPALDPALMHDLRAPSLQAQALGAIEAHAQATEQPTAAELDLIAEFQRTERRFFSNETLYKFATRGGPAPELPAGRTASERRGREFFVDAPFAPPSKRGICALCHSGPMLNLTSVNGAAVFPAPPGTRFHPIFVGQRNLNHHPVHTLLVDDDLMGHWVEVQTPDPGVLLTPAVLPPPSILPRSTFTGFFKTPQLWGVADTAPYFHDNSARTLEAVLEQYVFFFDNDPFVGGKIKLTAQDKADAVAFLKLLR